MKTIIALVLMTVTGLTWSQSPKIATRGLDHVGITVPDLKEAKAFFVDNFGCNHLTSIGPYEMPASMSNDRKSMVPPRAKSMTLYMLECGDGSKIELFAYEKSLGKTNWSDHEDLGAQHIAFYVDDLIKAIEYLKSKKITVIGEPMKMNAGVTAGETWVHFMAPWGLEMELVQSHEGKAYEKKNPKPEIAIGNHFQAINEMNLKKRMKYFKNSYHQNIVFIDPYFQVTGHAKLSEMYDSLHKKFPGHKFVAGKPEIIADTARVSWRLVNAKDEAIHTGQDILTLKDGKIQTVYVFIDGHNYQDKNYETHK